MSLSEELAKLSKWITDLPGIGVKSVGAAGDHIVAMDYINIGGVKRSLNLASGLHAMVSARNITCSRAILRMQVDTISRLLAYMYVTDMNHIATQVIKGEALRKFQSADGSRLTDKYLVDRMSEQVPWIRELYDFTSGDVHFSESQVEDSILNIQDDLIEILNMDGNNTEIKLSHIDSKYPESSWEEIVQKFIILLEILKEFLSGYSAIKASKIIR